MGDFDDDYRRSARCPQCRLSPGLCLCEQLPRIELPYRFLILRHGQEHNKQSNTGSLVPHLLPGSRLLDWGWIGKRMDRSVLVDPEVEFYNLFPIAGARTLSRHVVEPRPGRVPTFIILDATWGKARRMLRRIHEIQSYPRFRLPHGEQPTRVLREPPKEGLFSTLAAVVRTVEVMGDAEHGATLREFMNGLYQRVLCTRGKLPRGELGEVGTTD